MALARPPASTSNTLTNPSITAGESLAPGQAVAVLFEGGFQVAKLAGALLTDNARSFAGFAIGTYSSGQVPSIVVARGAIITPIIEGGGAFTPNSPVFLSITPGQVTQTPPTVSGSVVLPIGVASTTDKMMLTTDYKVINR